MAPQELVGGMSSLIKSNVELLFLFYEMHLLLAGHKQYISWDKHYLGPLEVFTKSFVI